MTGGVLVVDKPAGPTSFDVVQRVRRLLRADKAGHAGTLDPAATGVLAVCVGDAVRLQQYLSDADKAYEATVAFGAATDTEDAEGRVVETGDAAALTPEVIRAALPGFTGEILQVPPMYSAVRVGGRRLHEVARAGEAVERAARRVRVDALELRSVEPGQDGRVLARLAVRCGKGTYVRTLAADLGRAVGVPAHLAALRRTEASGFTLAMAVGLEAAEALGADRLRERLVTPADALAFLPSVSLTGPELQDIVHGRALARPGFEGPLVRALAADGRLAALCAPAEGGLRPVRVLLTPADLAAPRERPEQR